MEELNSTMQQPTAYNDDDIKTLDWMEHIRRRPGMYIGKLGDGSYADDGIYVLLKEVLDNSIDEYMMGYGKTIEVTVEEGTVSVRDYGRGVPLGKVVAVVGGTKQVDVAILYLDFKFGIHSLRELPFGALDCDEIVFSHGYGYACGDLDGGFSYT